MFSGQNPAQKCSELHRPWSGKREFPYGLPSPAPYGPNGRAIVSPRSKQLSETPVAITDKQATPNPSELWAVAPYEKPQKHETSPLITIPTNKLLQPFHSVIRDALTLHTERVTHLDNHVNGLTCEHLRHSAWELLRVQWPLNDLPTSQLTLIPQEVLTVKTQNGTL